MGSVRRGSAASNVGSAARGYNPGREAPAMNLEHVHMERTPTVLQRSADHRSGRHPATVNVRTDAKGAPIFATVILQKGRTPSVECRENLKRVCRNGEIAEWREAYKNAIDKETDCFLVPSGDRQLQRVLNRIRGYYDASISEALDDGERDKIEKAIKECEDDLCCKDLHSRELVKAKKHIEKLDAIEAKKAERELDKQKSRRAFGETTTSSLARARQTVVK